MTLTTQDKDQLRAMGICVYDVLDSTGEVIIEKGGVQYRDSVAHLKRMVRPTIWDRVCNWLIGREAA